MEWVGIKEDESYVTITKKKGKASLPLLKSNVIINSTYQ